MIPTVSQVFDQARQLVGATSASGQAVYSSGFLQPYLNLAYAEMFQQMQGSEVSSVQREMYYALPANTAYLKPATAGIANFGQPELMEERPIDTGPLDISAVTISGTGLGAITLTTPHGRADGQMVELYGVGGMSDDINDSWAVSVLSPNQLQLNGCTATGTYVSGGKMVYGTQDFSEILAVTRLGRPLGPENSLREYAWMNGAFRFRPCATQRELKLSFTLSGQAPTGTNDSLGIDDCLLFLSHRVGGLAASAKGNQGLGAELKVAALGPTGQAENCSGFLGALIRNDVRGLQRNRYIRPRFRPKRNTGAGFGCWNM